MKKLSGNIQKMQGKLASPIEYYLPIGSEFIHLNPLLNKRITLRYTGIIRCIQCNRKISKSFQQGFCFPCYRCLLACGLCIIHPERCHVEEGTCPKDDWAHTQCHATHIVYLANSSGLKVGITRETHIPRRWIDQGAVQALPVFRVKNRRQAGLVEVVLKAFVADKTNWRLMLRGNNDTLDLLKERDILLKKIENQLDAFRNTESLADAKIVSLVYPINQVPEKIINLSFDKNPTIDGILLGIKGQYLIFDTGVVNIRKFGGYELEMFFTE